MVRKDGKGLWPDEVDPEIIVGVYTGVNTGRKDKSRKDQWKLRPDGWIFKDLTGAAWAVMTLEIWIGPGLH